MFSAQRPDQPRRLHPPAVGAIVGRRQEQQDAARVEACDVEGGAKGDLLVVADGMGGHAGGREAAAVAVDAFTSAFQSSTAAQLRLRLREALEEANCSVAALAASRRELRGMGCTIVGAVLAGNDLRWISVGDSLLLAVKDGQIVRLNADHSLAPELDEAARSGLMSFEAARSDPDRHVLRSAVTGNALTLIDEGARRIGEGALVLLATDGLLTLPSERIAEIASAGQDVEHVVSDLLKAVERDMPADQDNTTVVAALCSGGALVGSRGRGRRGRRRGLALLALGAAIAIGTIAAAILVDAGQSDSNVKAGDAPLKMPADASRHQTSPPAMTGDFDGRVFKAKAKPRNQRRPRPATPPPREPPKAQVPQPARQDNASAAPAPAPGPPAEKATRPPPQDTSEPPARSGSTPPRLPIGQSPAAERGG